MREWKKKVWEYAAGSILAAQEAEPLDDW